MGIMEILEKYRNELLRRKYSPRTIETYSHCVQKFLDFTNKDIKKISKKDVYEYLNKLTNRAGSTINVHLQAIKFLLEEILGKRKMFYDIKISKTPRKLPEVLSKTEVTKLIKAISNQKHKLMIKLMYSAGLRVSELLNLKVEDLNLENNFGWVRKGKGSKDRMFILAKSLKKELHEFLLDNKLDQNDIIFTGRRNLKLSSRTIQEIIKKASKKAKITKKINPHTLRHSFATHLIENGYDVYTVQRLLGHNSPETTMIYLHLAAPNMLKIQSPLDKMEIENFNYGLSSFVSRESEKAKFN